MSQVGMAGTAFAAMASRLGLSAMPSVCNPCTLSVTQCHLQADLQHGICCAGIKTAVSQQVLTAAYDGAFLANPIQFNEPVTDKVLQTGRHTPTLLCKIC